MKPLLLQIAFSRRFVVLLALSLSFVASAPTAQAQYVPTVLRILDSEDAANLNLTDEQNHAIDKLYEKYGNLRDFNIKYSATMKKATEAPTQEERVALRREVSDLKGEVDHSAQTDLSQILNEQQYDQIKRIILRNKHHFAFREVEIQNLLGFSDEQKKTLSEIYQAHEAEFARLDYGRPNARAKTPQLTHEKIMDVLTKEQKLKWAEMTRYN